MPHVRGLIIAIEDYGGQLASLPGNVRAGCEFRQWLLEEKHAPEENILFCASRDCPGRTHGTTRTDIVTAIQRLYLEGAAQGTDELYVFFSGHGFSYQSQPWAEPVPVLVASNFQSWQQVDFAFIQLSELQFQLRRSLGPGCHYYFIDACRTAVDPMRVQVPPLGLALPPSERGSAQVFTLFAAMDGMPAPADEHFGTVLIDGLRGRGRAKGWDGGKLRVTFNRLMGYMLKRLAQREIDGDTRGSQPGIIRELEQVPLSTCTVEVQGAQADDTFELVAMDVRRLGSREERFSGASYRFQVEPDDYRLELRSGNLPLPRVEPAPPEQSVDLYDAQTVRFAQFNPFEMFLSSEAGLESLPGKPMLHVLGSSQGKVRLRHLDTGEILESVGDFQGLVSPGRYEIALEEQGVVVARDKVLIEGDQLREVDLLKRPAASPAHRSIRQALGSAPDAPLVDFSEQLGPMANQDLGLWLLLMGASRIVRTPDTFSKLHHLSLERFEDLGPDRSAVYVLAGFEEERPEGHISVGAGTQRLQPVPHLRNVWQARLEVPPGPGMLSLQVPGWMRMELATHALPNRVTLVVLTETSRARSPKARHREGMGRPQVRQMMLPVHSLADHLDPLVREFLEHTPALRAIRFSALAQERFARLESVEDLDPSFWSALLWGKWVDPVMSLLACYELLRRGRASELSYVVRNLRTFFPGLPDSEAIARLIGMPSQPVSGHPLFLEGLLTLEPEARSLARPGLRLDYEGPWTAWLGPPDPLNPGPR